MTNYVMIGIEIVAIVAASIVFSEALFRVISRLARIAGLSGGQIRTFREVYSLVWVGIAATAIIRVAGLSSELTTLTISGVAGLAISLALQTTLQNIISGILMFNDNILRLNDEVEFSGIKGTISRIGMRNAWIKQADETLVVVSNSNLSNGPLINHTASARILKRQEKMEQRREKAT